MNFPSAQQRNDFVARLLQLQAPPHHAGMVLRHLDGILIAEEVGRVQHVDMQRVAFDPLAAVNKPAQQSQLTIDLRTERVLDGVGGTHLVRDGADAANPRGDIGNFGKIATAQEGLKKTRRLKDFQLDVNHFIVADLDVETTLAFDASQVVNLDGLTPHAARFPGGTAQRTH